MQTRLFFPWLAIAIIAVAAQESPYPDDYEYDVEDFEDPVPLKVRSALTADALRVLESAGDVDVSLDGFDHELVARDIEDGDYDDDDDEENEEDDNEPLIQARSDWQAWRRIARMKPHYVQHSKRDLEDDDTLVDVVLDDDDDDDDNGSHQLHARDLDADADVDENDNEEDEYEELPELEPGSYDSGLFARDLGLGAGEEGDEEIDYSLEGHDSTLLRRGEDDDNDLSEDEDEDDFDSSGQLLRRDVASDSDVDIDEDDVNDLPVVEDEDAERNARYAESDVDGDGAVVDEPLQQKRNVEEIEDEAEGSISRSEGLDDDIDAFLGRDWFNG